MPSLLGLEAVHAPQKNEADRDDQQFGQANAAKLDVGCHRPNLRFPHGFVPTRHHVRPGANTVFNNVSSPSCSFVFAPADRP